MPQTGGGLKVDSSSYGDIGAGVGGVGSGIALLAGAAGRGGKRYNKKALGELEGVGLPEFDMENIDPAFFRVLAERFPELMEASVPGEVSLIDDSAQGRAGQVESMLGLGEIGREGLPDADRLAAEMAGRQVRGALRGGEEAAVSNLRRRGRAGAGGELQARLAGGSVASGLARDLGSNLQQLSMERRLQALGQQGQQAGQLRGADILGQGTNADAINRWREFSSMQQQQANVQNQAERSRAADYNVGTAQRVGEQTEGARYAADVANVDRQDRSRMNLYSAEQERAAQIANQYNTLATGAYNKQKAKAGQIQGIGSGVGGIVGGIGGLI